MSQLYNHDFSGDPNGDPANWDLTGTTAFTVTSGKFGEVTAVDGDIALLAATGTTALADADILYSEIVSATVALDGVLRATIDRQNYYLIAYQPTTGSVAIYKVVSGAFTSLHTETIGTTFSASDRIMRRCQVEGTALRLKVWLATDPEPSSFDVEITDSAISAGGYTGLRIANAGAAAATDRVTVSDFNTVVTGPAVSYTSAPGRTDLYAILLNGSSQAWNGSAYVNWTDPDDLPALVIQMTEQATPGRYKVAIPTGAQADIGYAIIYRLVGADYESVGVGRVPGSGGSTRLALAI